MYMSWSGWCHDAASTLSNSAAFLMIAMVKFHCEMIYGRCLLQHWDTVTSTCGIPSGKLSHSYGKS